jgi:RND family efflux transporter MFP subunit
MRALFVALSRWLLTTLIVTTAVILCCVLWNRYELEPWTRDGHVRVDVVRVTADVSGLVTLVAVHDNEAVHKGQLLFVVDQPRYDHALREAESSVASARALLRQAIRVSRRDAALGDLVAAETHEENSARVETSEATVRQLLAAQATAALNIERTRIYATVDGVINNLDLHPGDYIAAGQQALAIIDEESLRVEAYLEETKLDRVAVGDEAKIKLMGSTKDLSGHVVSLSSGIADDQTVNTANQLRQVNPTFTWVRLAQRIPIRIHIDRLPKDVQLIAGRTATVEILPHTAP